MRRMNKIQEPKKKRSNTKQGSLSKGNELINYPKYQNIKDSTYKITLAWTEKPGHKLDNTLKIIENYLTENGAEMIEDTPAEFDGYTEVMRLYKWTGCDKEFTILRKSANYILDIFAESQYEKFNISIFGNKKQS